MSPKPRPAALSDHPYDVAVIGAGFGGLSAALNLARSGARVVLFEALNYPGGCACTFTRQGASYEGGATLLAGFEDALLLGRWKRELDLAIDLTPLDPVIDLRSRAFSLEVPSDAKVLVDRLVALAPDRERGLRAFFDEQQRVGRALWDVLGEPELLPPWSLKTLQTHARRLGHYAPMARSIGRPLLSAMRRHGVDDVKPLRILADAVCQITLQCSAEAAEGPLGMSALSYFQRGAMHVRGGIGAFARALLDATAAAGASVHLACRVKEVVQDSEGWTVKTRHGDVQARAVVANVMPKAAATLWPTAPPFVADALVKRQADLHARGWGAAMLYRTVRPPPDAGDHARHLELIDDDDGAFIEGNHVFVSISSADDKMAPEGLRSVTVSTHVSPENLATPDVIAAIQQRMRETIAKRAPEWNDVATEMTASPRTFARFVGRPDGLVGGAPWTAGLHCYRGLSPRSVNGNRGNGALYLVGDSVFPGQSVLAVSVGGDRVAETLTRAL